MSKEILGYVKLEWTCPKCGSRNPGPEKTCQGCGAPQPDDVQFVQAAGEKASQDESLKKIVEKGADIHCAFCGTRNPADSEVCSQCGAELKSGVRRESGKVVGAYKPEPVKQIACPNCGAQNPEALLKCIQCGSPLTRPKASEPAAEPAIGSLKPRSNILLYISIAVIALICMIAAFAFISASSTKETQLGSVQSVSWQTIALIEALRPVTYQTWEGDVPQDAVLGSCQLKVYSVVDYAPAGEETNKVCGTPYTVDTGSGVGEVVQDCQFEVLRPYCEYTVEEWRVIDEARLQGTDLNPVFANPELTREQRFGAQSVQYVILFQTDEGVYRYPVNSLEEFQLFSIGSEWHLNVNGFGQIVSIEPVE